MGIETNFILVLLEAFVIVNNYSEFLYIFQHILTFLHITIRKENENRHMKMLYHPLLLSVLLFCTNICGYDAETASKPQIIKVGIYILSLGRLDMATGSFIVDMYLSLKSDEDIPNNNFEFINGRASNIDCIIDKPKEKFYRILANLTTTMDLHQYPFDRQKIHIVIEDKTRTKNEVQFVPLKDESGLDASIIFPGWNIEGMEIVTRDHEYHTYNEVFSQIVCTVNISRIRLNAFIKTFIPVIFLMLIVLSSFILNPEQVTTRLGAISSALIASAMFHISISNQIPPSGYLSFADIFMILTYLILLCCFCLSIAVYILQNKSESGKLTAKKMNRISEYLVFIGMPTLYICLFFFFLNS